MTLKSSQIVKAKDTSIYFKLTKTDPNPAPTSLQNFNNNSFNNDDNDAIDEFMNDDDADGDISDQESDSHVPISATEIGDTKKEASDRDHKQKYKEALARIKTEDGRKICVKSSRRSLTWTVIDEHVVLQKQLTRSNNRLGI